MGVLGGPGPGSWGWVDTSAGDGGMTVCLPCLVPRGCPGLRWPVEGRGRVQSWDAIGVG